MGTSRNAFEATTHQQSKTDLHVLIISIVFMFLASAHGRIWFEGDELPVGDKKIPLKPDAGKVEKVITRGITKIVLELEKVMGNGEHNLIFAPVSVASALALVLLGSAGSTSLEIANFLGVLTGFDIASRREIVHQQLGKYFNTFEENLSDVLGTHLTFASGVFIQEGFPINPTYDMVARNTYRSEVIPLDFFSRGEDSRHIINNWVYNRTRGHIKEILSDPVSPASRVVIANAFFFEGVWEHPFYPATRNRNFFVTPNEIIQVPMMANTAEVQYFENRAKGFKMFGMPYKGGELYMYIIVPKGDLSKFITTLTVDSMEEMINNTTKQMLIYLVPRMQLESTSNLKNALEKLGVRRMFNPNVADLSGLSKGAYASNVLHKVKIQVTETGTVASGVSAVAVERDGSIPVVRVDKPFVFFIYHKPSESIIFWGSVFRPTPYHNYAYQ